jgi:invasion protein IalB
MLRLTLATLALLGLAATSAEAQNVTAPEDPPANTEAAASPSVPMSVGSFKSWAAYTFEDKGRLMCYTQSAPTHSIGDPDSRGQAAVMVIQAPDAAAKDQFSIVLGFTPQDGKTVTVTIGAKAGKGKKYTLKKFAVGRAWAESAGQDKLIVSAMKRYNYLVVDSVSAKGEKVRDTYNLSGFGKAYDASVKACK